MELIISKRFKIKFRCLYVSYINFGNEIVPWVKWYKSKTKLAKRKEK